MYKIYDSKCVVLNSKSLRWNFNFNTLDGIVRHRGKIDVNAIKSKFTTVLLL